VFSGSQGQSIDDAAQGLKHGQFRWTTAGQIRAAGGTVEPFPEFDPGVGMTNYQHVNVCLGGGVCEWSDLIPNLIGKALRFGGKDYPFYEGYLQWGALMTMESYLDEIQARLVGIRGITAEVVSDPGGNAKILADAGGRREELRVMRDLQTAGNGDVLFVGHAFSDVERLLEVVRSGTHLSVEDAAEIAIRITTASPGPWTAFIESDGGQAGCDVIRVSESDDEPDMYLWIGSDLASSAIFRFAAAARQDIPALLAFARP